MPQNLLVTTLIASFVIQVIFFAYAAWFKTDTVTDLSYGLTFILITLFSLFKNQTFFTYQLITSALIILWGIRISGYLFIRILKIKRDKRFDGIRENFLKFAKFWFFQAIAVWIISLPATYIHSLNYDFQLNSIIYFGILVWLLGITIETIADAQKFKFKNDLKNKGKWIELGLWKYSRHPNYFGEMLCWWGIFIAAIPLLSGLSWLTVAGPLFITYILLFATGIPTLEKKYNQRYKDNKAYQDYKKNTHLLIPLPKIFG